MSLNKYDADVESGLNAGEIKKYNTEDYFAEDDCEVYGPTRTIKKNKVKEILKRHACTAAGFMCLGVFMIGGLYFTVTSLREGQTDHANEVMDLIDFIAQPRQPEMYSPSDITHTLIPSAMMVPAIPEMTRPPRRRRY